MDIFDEAKESLKEEKIQEFLNKNYKNIVLIIAIFIVSLSLGVWWNQHSKEQIYQDGGNYMMAILKMRSYNPEDAILKFNEVKENRSIYSKMSDLNIAAYNSFKNNHDIALKHYKSIANDRSTPKAMNDLAELLSIKTALSFENPDLASAEENLKSYVNKNPIFKASAQELLLAIYIEQNKIDDAKEIHNELVTDINIPRAIRTRVEQFETLLNL